MNLNELSATEAAKKIASGKIGVEALVAAHIERIRQREDTVGAWEYFDPDLITERAKELDRGPARGPLYGIPVGIKDVVDTVDMPTRYGSPIYQGHRPAWDASCVSLIRASGGIILGKTVTAELATFFPGKTVNPHNAAHTPGGSSSGSAAAVADCMAPLAIGTQTAGSVIRPASYCGIVGYKPSFGWINRVGAKMVSDTLDTLGIFARTVKDAALLGSVLTGRPLPAEDGPRAVPRVGFCKTYEWPHASWDSMSAFETAWQKVKDAGVETREIILPGPFSKLACMQADIMACEAAKSLAFEYAAHRELLSLELQELIGRGKAISVEAYDSALKHAAKCRDLLDQVFEDVDIILAPSVPGEAPEGLDSTGDPIFNRIWTLLRVPCVNLPAFSGTGGLPVGIQAVANYGQDFRLLAAADRTLKILAG